MLSKAYDTRVCVLYHIPVLLPQLPQPQVRIRIPRTTSARVYKIPQHKLLAPNTILKGRYYVTDSKSPQSIDPLINLSFFSWGEGEREKERRKASQTNSPQSTQTHHDTPRSRKPIYLTSQPTTKKPAPPIKPHSRRRELSYIPF